GRDVSAAPREWTTEERTTAFDPSMAVAVFDTPEIAIDPLELARRMTDTIAAHPRIELRLSHEVVSASEAPAGFTVTSRCENAEERERFDHVVNALWEGRLAVDETAGLRAGRRWLYRLKYGVGFSWPDSLPQPPSATFVSGPFGEVVSYPDRTTYLTWYPTCVREISSTLAPPMWPTYPPEPLRSEIAHGTIAALAE